MDKFAVAVMPVADVEGWKAFCHDAAEGERAQAHRDFLRRGGVTAEHIFHLPSPMGDLMVLVHEGVDQEGQAALLARPMGDPKTEYERYLRDTVITRLHGLDPEEAGSQPVPTRIAEIHA